MAISLNPLLMTNAAGTFSTDLDGYIQGFAMDDPSVRNWLVGGTLATTETVPMWGGVPVQETLADSTVINKNLGTVIKRATSQGTVTGFSVFNQNYAAVNTPQSPVPLSAAGMQVNAYRISSGARIVVAMDPALASSLAGSQIGPTALYWDVTNYRITATTTGGNWALPVAIRLVDWNSTNSMIVSYASSTGFATWTRTGAAALLQI